MDIEISRYSQFIKGGVVAFVPLNDYLKQLMATGTAGAGAATRETFLPARAPARRLLRRASIRWLLSSAVINSLLLLLVVATLVPYAFMWSSSF